MPSTPVDPRSTEPNLLLLVFLFISLVLTGGLQAWLRAGSTPREPHAQPAGRSTTLVAPQPVPVEVRPGPSTPKGAGLAHPGTADVPRASPRTEPPQPIPRPPASQRPSAPGVIQLRAQFALEGGGDPASIRVQVHQDGRCEPLATVTAGHDGRVCVEVPARTDYLLVATAPGHAFTLHDVDLRDGERDADAPVMLARELEYVIDVIDLDLTPREVETRRVRAGQLVHDLRFTQEGASLHAAASRGPCEARALEGPLERVTETTALAGIAGGCDFELPPGAVFAVSLSRRWFAVRLREPGRPAPLSSAGFDGPRRVIKGIARR